MPTRISPRIALIAVSVAGLVAGWGCDDTVLTGPPLDVGGQPRDTGISESLPLEVGMTFEYRAILTAREDAATDLDSSFDLTVIVDAVDEDAQTLTFSASGTNLLLTGWTPEYDFSSWVARLGPALAGDQVVEDRAVVVDLTAVPGAPDRPNPKVLPTAGPFFFDARDVDALRAAFAQTYADSQPAVAEPSATANGRWQFSLIQTDPTIITYNVQRRQLTLEYDPRGFLTRMTETLGDVDSPPSGNFRLELQSGP